MTSSRNTVLAISLSLIGAITASAAQVAVRLFEVVAEDFLELEAAVAVGVGTVGPAHEFEVQVGTGALEQRGQAAKQP